MKVCKKYELILNIHELNIIKHCMEVTMDHDLTDPIDEKMTHILYETIDFLIKKD